MSEHRSQNSGLNCRDHAISRRSLLGQTMLASGCGVAGLLSYSTARGSSQAESSDVPATPEEALRTLMDGNQRFAAGKSTASNRDIDRVREVSRGQKPFAAFLGCGSLFMPT